MNTLNITKPLTLDAELLGYNAREALSAHKKAPVQGIFDQALYIRAGEESVLRIIGQKEFASPSSIVVKPPAPDFSFRSLGLTEKSEFTIDGNILTAEEIGFSINLANASELSPQVIPKDSRPLSLEEINLNIRVLRDVIYTCPTREGLVPLLENVELYGPMEVFLKEQRPGMAERARPHIDRLMWGLMAGDMETIHKSVEPILGLGPGLTPSCDDFLSGLLESINLAGGLLFGDEENTIGFFKKAVDQIAALAREKTTIYSLSLINEAAYGQGPQAAFDVIESVLTKSPDSTAKASKTLIAMGETSGADIAVGILYGIRFLISRIELRELNESI
jgi:hypothetical protein